MLIVLAVLLLLNLLPGGHDRGPCVEAGRHTWRCASCAGSRERTGQSVAAAPESEARLCGYLSQRHDLH